MRHPYLNDDVCVERLLAEYRTHGSLVVAYDYDNTVYDYHHKGQDYGEVVELLRDLKRVGCHLIVFTASEDIPAITKYLKEHDIPYDAINENPPFFQGVSRKIYYNSLLDDRAGFRSAYDQLRTVLDSITT